MTNRGDRRGLFSDEQRLSLIEEDLDGFDNSIERLREALVEQAQNTSAQLKEIANMNRIGIEAVRKLLTGLLVSIITLLIAGMFSVIAYKH